MNRTRFAPSPTGALHLGNARTFLINWLLARQNDWQIVLRIEDMDGPRIKQGADVQAMDDLRWLGLLWDEGPTYQSRQIERYRAALKTLQEGNCVYPCICTRKDIDHAASAPHAQDGAAVYPGTCRGRFKNADEARAASGREPCWRFAVPPGVVRWDDEFARHQAIDVTKRLGDFVVTKADGTPSYQLAVVVDDIASGITDVVRGDDLIDSTPRQMLLYHAFGTADQIPHYYHLPLVVGTDGRRLAKRHGDTRISFYREQGVPAGRILSLLGRWSGMEVDDDNLKSVDLLKLFDINAVPHQQIVFGVQDERALGG